ncbi:hypothetical protein CKY02_02605 [Photorhabdus bodei]|uniref:Uncharacterized protein n=1 Tax=Photorhabdus bodei TaxID=2029681 RepID=A0A329XBJ0_9GAMM|nr:hypothetical protein CKY02_02605 [Photorhabdus bodei]
MKPIGYRYKIQGEVAKRNKQIRLQDVRTEGYHQYINKNEELLILHQIALLAIGYISSNRLSLRGEKNDE